MKLYVFAQDNHEENHTELKNTVVLSFGYTHIPKGAELESEEANGFFVPSLGLDYVRRVGHSWEIGLMLDYELDHYLIVDKELERENAFIVIAGAAYNPIGHLIIFTDSGIELEQNEHLFVCRLGADDSFHLNEHWAIVPAFYFDWKEGYDTYALSPGLGYSF